jgi:hypothetical protein
MIQMNNLTSAPNKTSPVSRTSDPSYKLRGKFIKLFHSGERMIRIDKWTPEKSVLFHADKPRFGRISFHLIV